MAFRNPFIPTRGSPSGDSPPPIVSPGYENSPFGPDEPAAIPCWLPRPASVSDRSTSVYTGTETNTPGRGTPAPEVIDLTNDEDPQVAQCETTRISPIPPSGGGHNWGARSGSAGGDYKVAISSRSDARRVAASRSKSVGGVELRGAGWGGDSLPARPTPMVNQHTGPSSRASGTITNASTASHIENIYSLITQLQQGQEAHDTRFATNENTVKSVREEFSAKINDAESRIEGIGKQLMTRMDEAEGKRRREREEDVRTRVQEEKNQIFRHGVLVGALQQRQGFGLVRQNAEPYGVCSPTSYQYEVAPPETSQHTHSSQSSPRRDGRSPRLSGYEDPRMSKCSRGKRPNSNNNPLRKTRRHSAASSRNHTPRSTPTVSECGTSPGKGVIGTAHSIKYERSLYSSPATPSQHSPPPKRETSSAVPDSSPIYH